MTTLLCCTVELLGSIDLAPALCGLEIISRLSPQHTSLLDFLMSPCFCGSRISRMLFWLSVLHIETGSPVGVVRRLQGGSKGVREKLSVYFLSLALGNCTTSLLHIFSVLAGFCLQVSRGEDKLFPVLVKFCFSHGLLIISVVSMAPFFQLLIGWPYPGQDQLE